MRRAEGSEIECTVICVLNVWNEGILDIKRRLEASK